MGRPKSPVHRCVLWAMLAAVLAGPAALAADGDAAAATVFVNAQVFTGEPAAPYAQAVAIRGDRILAVGERSRVEAAAGPSARIEDLHGGFLMPGMIDAHAHVLGSKVVLGGGYTLVLANYPETEVSLDKLVQFVDATIARGQSRFGDTTLVFGVDIGYWAHAAQIDERLSDGRYATVPIVLIGNDGHTAWGNRIARERAGISAAAIGRMAPEQRAYYGFGKDFVPNGFVVDAGLTRLRQSLPEPGAQIRTDAARAGVHYMNALGITGWLEAAVAGVVGGDVPLRADDTGALESYRDLSQRGELSAHVAAYPVIRPRDGLAQLDVAQALQRQFRGVDNLTLPGIKVFADGVVEYPSQTAALTRPYRNTGRSAPLLFDPQDFDALVTEADRRGLTVHIHAIGDLAVKASLHAIGAARRANPQGRLPHTITHAQFVAPEDIARFARYDVAAALQLLWAVADPSTNEDVKPYIDPAIHAGMYPARALLDAGALIAGASDWPVSSANPFLAMAQAETRDGPQGVLDARQRMPREAMLYAYTRNAARVLDQLDSIGTIAPGKRADLVLLDRDVLTVPVAELRETRVLWTRFGGHVVYQDGR